jgi:signal peptidase I
MPPDFLSSNSPNSDSPGYPFESTTSPDFPPPPTGQITSPDFPPPFQQDSQTPKEYKKGDIVHFRGDTKPARLWEIQEVGNEFISIRTQDNENLEAKDNVKIVTKGDIYTPSSEYPYQAGGYIYPYMDFQQQQGGGFQIPNLPSPFQSQPQPVNITFAPKLVGGDDNSKTFRDPNASQQQQQNQEQQSGGGFFQQTQSQKGGYAAEMSDGNEYDGLSSKSKIDFSQVVVKKME